MPTRDELMSSSNQPHLSSRVKSYQGTRAAGLAVDRPFPAGALKNLPGHQKRRGGMINFGMAAAALLALFAVGANAQPIVVPIPTVEGPITGPGDMQPGIRPGPDGTNLSDFDYLDEEYFISGVAAGQPYKTRIVIRWPKTPEKFSGVVLGEPTHRGGNGLICQYARYGIGQRGHACMTVAARRINLTNPATPGAGLYEFNLARYG